tara:strand:+ start:48520 stop:49284 length:765 start_codon:yes stop_codon:yes gene_type:complete
MTKHIILTLLAALATATAGVTTGNQLSGDIENNLGASSISLDAAFTSQELWRGVTRGDDSTHVSAFSNITFSNNINTYAGVTLRNTDNTNSEYIFTGGVSKDFSDLGLPGTSIGVVFNYYTEGTSVEGNITSEVGVILSQRFDSFLLDKADITQYFTTEGEGQGYGELELVKTVNILGLDVDLTGGVGYLADESELTHAQLTISTDCNTGINNLVVTPFVTSLFSLTDDSNRARGIYSGAEDEVAVGFQVGYKF